MQLTVNVSDLSELTLMSADGEKYVIVKEENYQSLTQEIETLLSKTRRTIVNQKELREIYRCGMSRIESWVAQGLSEIRDGQYVLYDLDEVEALLKSMKI